MTSGHSWGPYMCPIVFSMIRGKNTFKLFHVLYFHLFGQAQHHSWSAEILTLNLSVNLQLYFTGQHGQHLPKRGPAGGGRERGDTLQASLPPGEWRTGAKLPRLMRSCFILSPVTDGPRSQIISSVHIQICVDTLRLWWRWCLCVCCLLVHVCLCLKLWFLCVRIIHQSASSSPFFISLF